MAIITTDQIMNFTKNVKAVTDITELETEVSQLSASLVTVQGDVDELETSISQLSGSLVSVQGDVEDLQDDVDEIELDVSQISASVLTIGEDVEKLKTFSEIEEIIGEWTDGSTLYRKVFNISSLSTGNNNIPHNITNLDKIISIDSTFAAFGYQYKAPAVIADTPNSINIVIGSENITVDAGTNIAGNLARLTIILTYTKSS